MGGEHAGSRGWRKLTDSATLQPSPPSRTDLPASPFDSATASDPRWSDDVRDRIPVSQERARLKVERVTPNPAVEGLLAAARSARSVQQRVIWMRRVGSAWAEPLAREAPCRRGCSHCCHVSVSITSVEAELIAKASGRPAVKPSEALPLGSWDRFVEGGALEDLAAKEQSVVGKPCLFLKDSECSIYASRPFACRTHLSLDDDDLLCRLVDGASIPVPRPDTRLLIGYFLSMQPSATLADIRDFFPDAPAGLDGSAKGG